MDEPEIYLFTKNELIGKDRDTSYGNYNKIFNFIII